MKNKLDVGSLVLATSSWRICLICVYSSQQIYMGVSFVPILKWYDGKIQVGNTGILISMKK